jgi:hypothetical protein
VYKRFELIQGHFSSHFVVVFVCDHYVSTQYLCSFPYLLVGPYPVLDGWDCRFISDDQVIRQTLLGDTNTQSVDELLHGFFNYYANMDLLSTVLCPRTGLSFTVPEFQKIVNDTPTLHGFKVRNQFHYHSVMVTILSQLSAFNSPFSD